MSEIDKAFLNAYAKKRPSAPSQVEPRSLVDPSGERVLKIHLATPPTPSLQPHIAAAATAPFNAPPFNAQPFNAQPFNAQLFNAQLFNGPPVNAPPVNAPPAAPKATILNSQRSDARSVAIPSISAAQLPAAGPPAAQSKPVNPTQPTEPAPRKTLTSYLQQARQMDAAPSQPIQSSPTQHKLKPNIPLNNHPASNSASTSSHVRVDTAHHFNPPVSRPESAIPWSFGTVERSVKATADSISVTARTTNDPKTAIHSNFETKLETQSLFNVDAPRSQESIRCSAPNASADTIRRPATWAKNSDGESLAKIAVPIQPVWEVDEFLWPSAVANLLSTQAESFSEIGLHLQHAQSKGLRVLSITSGERGVGRSTTAMCLAKTLSKMGMRIGLFDGDYECPSLVDQLNLEAQGGWQQCLLENYPLDEIAIHSMNESVTLFPLTDTIAASQVAAHTLRINKLIKRISNAFDMVIIDANRLTLRQSQLLGTGEEAVLDAALLIVDAELSLRQRVDAAIDMVKQQEVQSIGLVENFHS